MPSPKRKRLATLLLLATPILTACGSLTATGGTDLPPEVDPVKVACEAFGPISWSYRDTDQTIREVKAHNASWKELCGQEV